MVNIFDLLVRAAESFPRENGIVDRDGQRWTFCELHREARRRAGWLAEKGVHAGDRVAILLESGGQAAALFFSCSALGAIAVMINESLRPRQIAHIVGDSQPKVLVTAERFREVLRQTNLLAATPCFVEETPGRETANTHHNELDDVAQLIYTSGSTGNPKGVMVTHGNLLASGRIIPAYLGIRSADRIATVMSFSFTYGFSQLICSIATGASLWIEDSTAASTIATNLRVRKITVLGGVPTLWSQLLTTAEFNYPMLKLRVLTNAGGHLSASRVRAIRARQPQANLFLMYGMTESIRTTFLDPAQVDDRPDSIGLPIAETDVRVLRPDGSEADVDEVGELVQTGPTVTRGYWNAPESNAAKFSTGPGHYRTVMSGDLVRRDADGFLYFVSRKDRMIKSLGYRICPDEVADVLLELPYVNDAAVFGLQDEQRGQRIVASLVLSRPSYLEETRRHLRRVLPGFMQPATYVVLEDLPRLPGGKHDYNKMREIALSLDGQR